MRRESTGRETDDGSLDEGGVGPTRQLVKATSPPALTLEQDRGKADEFDKSPLWRRYMK